MSLKHPLQIFFSYVHLEKNMCTCRRGIFIELINLLIIPLKTIISACAIAFVCDPHPLLNPFHQPLFSRQHQDLHNHASVSTQFEISSILETGNIFCDAIYSDNKQVSLRFFHSFMEDIKECLRSYNSCLAFIEKKNSQFYEYRKRE